jgi:hypothetical protein
MKSRLFSMKNSLYSKLVMTYFAVIFISFVFLAILLSIWFEGYYYNDRKQTMLSEVPVFNSMIEGYYNGTIDPSRLTDELNVLDKLLGARIWIIDRWTFIIGSSDKQENLIGNWITADELNKVFKGETVSKGSIFEDKFKTPMLTVAFPLTINNAVAGAVVMNSPLYQIKAAL